MPTTLPMPTTTIWDQYAVAAIVFVVFIVIGIFAWQAFKDFRAWQSKETDRQQVWYESMEKKRDDAQLERDLKWQQFYSAIQDHQAKRDRDNNEIMSRLISRIDALTDAFSTHDKRSAERADNLHEAIRGKRRAA